MKFRDYKKLYDPLKREEYDDSDESDSQRLGPLPE